MRRGTVRRLGPQTGQEADACNEQERAHQGTHGWCVASRVIIMSVAKTREGTPSTPASQPSGSPSRRSSGALIDVKRVWPGSTHCLHGGWWRGRMRDSLRKQAGLICARAPCRRQAQQSGSPSKSKSHNWEAQGHSQQIFVYHLVRLWALRLVDKLQQADRPVVAT